MRTKTDELKIYNELLRRRRAAEGVADFTGYMMDVKPARHHRLLCEKLDRLLFGSLKRLIVAAPPGSAKSTYCSMGLPSFVMGRFRGFNVVSASHTAELAETWGRKVRNYVDSPTFRKIFPDTMVDPANRSAGRWSTMDDNTYFACGVGGSVTGRRADLLICDDLFRGRQDADSLARRNLVYDWFKADAYTRLKPGGRVVLIATRWNEDDLTGRLLQEMEDGGEEWEVLSLPAICEDPEVDPLGRKYGEPLWPEWQPLSDLERIKSSLTARDWSSLYQQSPSPQEGNLVHRSWFKFYDLTELPKNLRIIQSWDTATVVNARSDPSVCLTIGIDPDYNYYLLDCFRQRLEFPDLQRAVLQQALTYNPGAILIEDKGSGQSLIQTLKGHIPFSIIACRPQIIGNKEFRFDEVRPVIEAGRLFLPKGQKWVEGYVEELVTFPGAKHDDQVDATSQALTWAAPKPRRGMRRLAGA